MFWLIPVIVTIVAFVVANVVAKNECTKNDAGWFSLALDPFVYLFYNGAATIVTLVTWIIYLILRQKCLYLCG